MIQPLVQSIWIPATLPKLSGFPALGDCISDFRFNSSEVVQKSCMYKHLTSSFPAWEGSVDGNLGQLGLGSLGCFWSFLFSPFIFVYINFNIAWILHRELKGLSSESDHFSEGFVLLFISDYQMLPFLTFLRRSLNIPDLPFVKNLELYL